MKGFALAIFFVLLFVVNSEAFDLDLFLKKAEENDYALKVLLLKEKAGKERIEQAKGRYYPQVTATAYYGWQEYKPYYANEIRQTLKYYFLSLRQPIFRKDLLEKIKQSKASLEVERLKTLQEKQYVKYVTLINLIDYAYSNSKIKLYRELVKLEKEKLDVLEKLFKRKLASKEDIELTKREIIANQEKIEHYSGLRDTTAEVLKISTGMKVPKDLNLMMNYNTIEKIALIAKSLGKKIGNNLELKIAKANIKVAEFELRARRAQRLPRLDFSLSYSYTSSSAISVASRDKRAALTLEIPIYQREMTAQEMEALALKRASELQVKATLNEKKRQFAEEIGKIRQALAELSFLKERKKSDIKLLEFKEESLKRGIKTELDVLEQKRILLNDELEVYDQLKILLSSFVDLLYLTSSVNSSYISLLKPLLSVDKG